MKTHPRRPNATTLLLGLAIVVIIGLSAALIIATMGGDNGSAKPTAKPTITPAARPAPATTTVSGAVTMDRYEDPDSQFRSANWRKIGTLNCEGIGGYDDMTEGAIVTVYDSAGSVRGVGALRKGLTAGKICAWSFEVLNVPEAQFYQVEVSHRGKVAVPRSQASMVSLSLG